MPGEANSLSVPVPTGDPVQSEVVYRFTVDPASALPKIFGELLLAGESGVVPLRHGVLGPEPAVSTVTRPDAVSDWPSGLVMVTSCAPLVADLVSKSSVTWVGSV